MAHVILQAPRLMRDDIERLAAVACASGVQELTPTAVRLLGVASDTQAEVMALAQAAHMDAAWLESIRRLADCKLLAMDMDSTLVNIECIDEIAAAVGRKAEVAAITEAAMRGELKDFSESLRRRVALLKGVPQSALEQVFTQRLRLNPGAEALIQAVQKHGIRVVLVSGGFTFFTERLRRGLMLDEAHANTLEIVDGVLTGRVLGEIVDGAVKARHVQAAAQTLGAVPEQIIVLGDGSNDLPMMALAHYSVAYRAKPVVRAQARFALDVSPLDAVLNWFRRQH
ncbi:MAG: phosphoserine phosphatase SerB [Castellaniella sp.]|uniref:phosphoserine phosphatase SerB n=1 Tax=Castellaniella sp. TaxID=1955812 RepID=UPI00121FD13F|nr:phosphoserine phosphatase SerB [Castellaniella sp.]TAN30193.1 MAG: phosphoserine phosphatase SerB [Castellaniella sp.]